MEQLDLEHKLALEVRARYFFAAFTRHWWTLVSGGASIPSTFTALFVSAWLAKALWGCAAVLCAGFASYWVWRDQREAYVREATKNSKPDLQMSIRRVWVRVTSLSRLTGETMKMISRQSGRTDVAKPSYPFDVYVQLHMTNGTQVATTVQEYQLTVGPCNNRITGSYFKNLKDAADGVHRVRYYGNEESSRRGGATNRRFRGTAKQHSNRVCQGKTRLAPLFLLRH